MILINEDFSDFKLNEYPYDVNHTALGEYHHYVQAGYTGNWYDPICNHQYRAQNGNWIVTEENGIHFMEQSRGDIAKGAFASVFSVLVNKKTLFSSYTLSCDIRIFELNNYVSLGFNYQTSRDYYAVGINGNILSLYQKKDEDLIILSSKEIIFDDFKTYHLKIEVNNVTKVYLDDKLLIEYNLGFINKTKIALVSKSMARYSNLILEMNDDEYNNHLLNQELELKRIEEKKNAYPKLKLINKIDLKDFGAGRQLRIVRYNNQVYFVLAQHQKRFARDSFAHLASMTCFKEDGSIVWTMGEPNNTFENTLISCDLPFQIADINNDGKLEIIYARNFEVIIADFLTLEIIKSMKTPIIYGDELVKNEPFYRLNVDAIRVADFSGKGYKSDFIIKDRYQNVWAYSYDLELLWRYHHKNTGHFPYIFDYNNDGYDEMLVGYDLVSHNGDIIWSLGMNSDHTDEIICARLNLNEDKKLILASGNEGMNIVNLDGTIYKHNEVGHSQRISVAKYDENIEGLQIISTSFWGSDGLIYIFDCHGNRLGQREMETNGSVVTPINYDGEHFLSLLHAGADGGLMDSKLDTVVEFPNDNHPTLCCEAFDLDDDGIDEIICWDTHNMYIYKAESFKKVEKKYIRYPNEAFSNYRGEYIIPEEYSK